jgi:hypothetical protein
MDERKKQIEELEKNRRESLAALDSLFERIGEELFSRVEDAPPAEGTEACRDAFAALPEAVEYRRLRREIVDSEVAIKTVEEQIRRFRELEERIEHKEQENAEYAKKLAGVYARLGKKLLDNAAYQDFAASFREQTDALVTKVRSLEERVSELEQKDGSNVFAWIGKSAQGLVLRSFLTKAQDNLEQLYRNAGESYVRQNNLPPEAAGGAAGDVVELIAEVEKARGISRALSEELVKLREERREISGTFGAEGSPLKQIQTLKNNITRVKDDLRVLYRGFGAEAAAAGSPADSPFPAANDGMDERGRERKQCIDALAAAGNRELPEDAARLSRSICETEAATAKLRASLAVDDEQAKIEKYRRLIEDRKAQIAEAENYIAEAEDGIKSSEKYIGELQKLL